MSLSADREQPLLQAQPDAVVSDLLDRSDESRTWPYLEIKRGEELTYEERFKRHFPDEYKKLLDNPAEEKNNFEALFKARKDKVYGNLSVRKLRLQYYMSDADIVQLSREKPSITFRDMYEYDLFETAYLNSDQPMLDYFYGLCIEEFKSIKSQALYPSMLLSAAIYTHQRMDVIKTLAEKDAIPVSPSYLEYVWPLKAAAVVGDFEAVRYLCEKHKVYVNYQLPYYESALASAARRNFAAIVQYLISKKAKVDVRRGIDAGTPLAVAASKDSAESARCLLDAGASVNRATGTPRDNRAVSALVICSKYNSLKVLKEILKKPEGVHFSQQHSLEMAIIAKHFQVAALLLLPALKEEVVNEVARLQKLNPRQSNSFVHGMSSANTLAQISAGEAIVKLIDETPDPLAPTFLERLVQLETSHHTALEGPLGAVYKKLKDCHHEIQQGLATQRPQLEPVSTMRV